MKIAVNTRLLIKGKLEGIGWFTNETLKRITQQHQDHQFYFLFDRSFDESFIYSDNVNPVVISPQARHPILYYIWFEYSVAKALNKLKPDLFFSPDGYLSLSTHFKSMNVFHDLNFEHIPRIFLLQNENFTGDFSPVMLIRHAELPRFQSFQKVTL